MCSLHAFSWLGPTLRSGSVTLSVRLSFLFACYSALHLPKAFSGTLNIDRHSFPLLCSFPDYEPRETRVRLLCFYKIARSPKNAGNIVHIQLFHEGIDSITININSEILVKDNDILCTLISKGRKDT